MRTHRTRDRFRPEHARSPDEDPDDRLLRAALKIAAAARELGYENGLAGVDPSGECLTASAPKDDDGYGYEGPPCEFVLDAYRVAWARGRDRSTSPNC